MIRRCLGTLVGAALIAWILAGCERPIACPVPVDAGPCLTADGIGPLYVGPLKTGRRKCWLVAGGIVCPSEPPFNGAQPVGEFATADGWQMIDEHAAQWNAIEPDVARCSR